MRLAFVAAALLAASLHAESINGAGGTLPEPLYRRWIETFLGNRPNDHISYDALGSGQGIVRLFEGHADFAASDVCETAVLTPLLMKGWQANNVQCIPMAAAAVVPIFTLGGVSQDLRLTPELLAGIYLGRITKWNDPAIRAVNRSVSLPDRAIVAVHRSDASGTTYAFSDYLSLSSEPWRKSLGKGMTIQWPSGVGAETNDGVARLVQQTNGAIGYVELLYAIRHHLGVIALRNRAGHYVRADLETVSAAAATASPDLFPSSGESIADASDSNAYPLTTFTYILLMRNAPEDGKRKLLRDFLAWALDSGQRQAAGLGYVAIPPSLSAKARAALGLTP